MGRRPEFVTTKIQWIAAIEVSLLNLLSGANLGWITPFVGKLSRTDPPFPATKEQISWVASMTSMSRMISIIVGSIAANFFGTKTSLYACGCFHVGTWVSLIYANSINMILFSQFCCGLGIGAHNTIYPLYFGEILNPKIRGTVISFVTNFNVLGILYGNLMGLFTEHWTFGIVNLVVTGIYLVTFFFFPPTPQYLINSKKLEEAEKALAFYNNGANVKEEFTKLHEFTNSSPRVSFLKSLCKLKDPVNLKTFIMINIVYSIVQSSGTYSIFEYLEVIFMASKIEIILPSTLVTIMSIIALPASWVAVATGDKFERVTMLMFSCVLFSLAFVAWGLTFHLLEFGFRPTDLQWIVITSAFAYRINMTIGLTPLVPVLMSEMFAPNVKSVSACLCNITCSLCRFLSIKYFQAMVDNMTYKYLFYFYAGVILVVGIYTKMYIPETKGKTLQEIQEKLQNNKTRNKIEPTQIYVNNICEQTSKNDEIITKL